MKKLALSILSNYHQLDYFLKYHAFYFPMIIKVFTPKRVNRITPKVITDATIIFLGDNLRLDPFLTLLKNAPTTTTARYLEFLARDCYKNVMYNKA